MKTKNRKRRIVELVIARRSSLPRTKSRRKNATQHQKLPYKNRSADRRAPEKKKIQGRQGSQPSAARKREKNSRNRQQGRNNSWKVFSGSSFFLGEEDLLPRRLPAPSDSPWSGQDPISAFFPSLHSFMVGNRHHP